MSIQFNSCCCRHHVIFHKIQANSCHGVLHLMAALMLDIRLMTDKSQAEVRLSDSETCVNKSVFNSPLHKYWTVISKWDWSQCPTGRASLSIQWMEISRVSIVPLVMFGWVGCLPINHLSSRSPAFWPRWVVNYKSFWVDCFTRLIIPSNDDKNPTTTSSTTTTMVH